MNEQELSELEEWIAVNLFGWQKFREEEYPHRMLWREGESGSPVWDEPDWYTTDPAPALLVLEKCIVWAGCSRIISFGSTADGNYFINHSDLDPAAEAFCTTEAKTLPLAICLFAKAIAERATSPSV